jgi:hypothetical protein
MFIEFHIEGLNQPQLIPVGKKASDFALELEKRGKKFTLGKTHY